MPLHQYVYFALVSARTTAQEMTDWLGIEPDEIVARGLRDPSIPLPASHRWKIVCRKPGLRVDEQIDRVVDRLRQRTGRIAELLVRLNAEEEGGTSAVLQVVRYFTAEEPATLTSDHPNLFGWHLDPEVLAFLAATGATLDVDEYDMT
ncbi:DUF4279 domain-containing protein [Streptomyces sp. YC504]|uniref:DUF4279 domain-containing protein n=1 Tax=Streptomyces mesophilus TaxID=1775132 RepID=A0A6G4XFZ0_9ACTN|nr:DUF4279 domain-containing protein [Streptomyces mesophilus]NGO75747.1 DUF4279 domain-containing protein [Streptomyces mesophilus]